MRTYKITVLLIILFSSLFSNDKLKQVSLQLQWKYQFQFAGYIMAKEKGFYKDIGLDVDIKEWHHGIDMVDEVIKGKSEYAVSRPTSMIDISKGKDIIYLATIYQSSPLVLLTDKSSGINTVKEFKNKKIMTTGDLNTDTSLISMMFSQGVKLEDLNILPPSFDPKDLINGKTDLMASYISNEPFVLKEMGGDPIVFSPKDYGFDFYNDIVITSQEYLKSEPEEVRDFRRATLRGWEYAFANIDETVHTIYSKYNTQNRSKDALSFEANELKKLAYFQTNKIGKIEEKKLEKIYDVYKLLGLVRNNINFNKIIYNELSLEVELTKKEKEYLREKESITMCIDPNWMPFERFDEKGKYIGMSADYFKLFEKTLDTKIEVIKTDTWSKSIEYAKQRKCDILSLAMETPERKKYLNFTTPYLSVPLVVTTKLDVPFINDIEDLKGKKIGIPKGYAFVELLRNKYPFLNIIEVKNIDEGLIKVNQGELYAYIGTYASVSYSLQKNLQGELKIAGKFSETWSLGIGVRNDDKILIQVLQKAVNNLDSDQKREILNKWVSVRYEKGIDYTLVWEILILSSLALIIMGYIYNKQRVLNEKLKMQKDEFETIFKNSKDGIALLDLESRFLNFNDEYLRMTGFTKEELLTKSCIELSDPKDVQRAEEIMEKVAQEGYVQNFEKTCIVKDDKRIIINMSLSLMPDKKRVIISTKDITQLKQLESQTKLASMGEMIGNIAHQWRQPLSIISTSATGLQLKKEMDMLKDEEFDSLCNHINENAQYLSQTIDDFRNFIKGDTIPVDFNLKNDTDSFIKLINSTIKSHNIQIMLDLEEHIELKGYPNELIQCFINIFNNSKDAFMENNIKENERLVFITQKIESDKVIITFKDNAGGIPENIISKIFEPYFTTKHESQGTGLGLHMSYNLIVNHMNGDLEVFNREYEFNKEIYKGAEFIITIPIS